MEFLLRGGVLLRSALPPAEDSSCVPTAVKPLTPIPVHEVVPSATGQVSEGTPRGLLCLCNPSMTVTARTPGRSRSRSLQAFL